MFSNLTVSFTWCALEPLEVDFLKLILDSEKGSKFVTVALNWSGFHDKHMPSASEFSFNWFVEAPSKAKAEHCSVP